MEIHSLKQGTPEWHAYRAEHFNASDAPAMLGCSPYKSRAELLKEMFTGTAPDVDAGTQARFDDGHRFERLSRARAEELVGGDLYPVTGSLGKLSASFDGITMAGDVIWEHKTLNNDIRAAETVEQLGKHLRVQMEQQLAIGDAERVLFLATKYDNNDQLVEEKHFWYTPDEALRAEIIAGWDQFDADLAAYAPKNFAPKAAAEPIMQLPTLVIRIKGEVATSNLSTFQAKAETFIASIKTDLLTDEDFANAEETIKFCDKAEKSLEQAKAAAIAQTADIDELMRTVDHISAQLREKRLTLTRTVKDKKELLKAGILAKVKLDFQEHVAALEEELAPLRLVFQARDFAGAMKNKRTLASLHDAVDTELAAGKISVDALAKAVRGRLAWYKEHAAGYEFLFADLQQVIQKPDDDFQLAVKTRINARKAVDEAAKQKIQDEADAEAARKVAPLAAVAAAPAPAANEPEPQPTGVSGGWQVAARTVPATPASLRLGQIADRLGFTVTADFMRTLGFEPAARDRAAMLYHEADFANMCAALIRHITSVRADQAVAA